MNTIKIKSHKYPNRPHVEVEGKLLSETSHYFFVACEKNTLLKHYLKNESYLLDYKTLHFLSKYHGYTVSISIDEDDNPVKIFCNISTPCEKDEEGNITYIDLDMDYVKSNTGQWFLRNNDMFLESTKKYNYPLQLTNFALVSLQELKNNIKNDVFPFGIENFKDVDGPIK
ncbi:DUF402 domain-containing protein [Macrococcus animalis]|uniref:DUF402 domain-containing protein n=1 Tax=Macrococcus animalis TaxID=3395467 RepID=UPI0039BF2041